MRRFFTLALLLIFWVPAAAFAQDTTPAATSQGLWDLSGVFNVTDLGFSFNYPGGWFTQSQSGVYLAESTDDLTALTDSDDKTIPAGYTISLVALPLDAAGLTPDATLDDAVTAVVTLSGITEQQRSELPVLSRRSISIFGLNSAGRPGIASIWLQDGNVVIFAVGAPEASADLAFSWGQILGSAMPLNALEMGDTPLASPNGDFTISYPKDWFTDPSQPSAAAALKDDLGSGSDLPKGLAIVIFESHLDQMGADVTDLQSLGTYVRNSEGWDDTVVPTEHVILDQPALTYAAPNKTGNGGYIIVTVSVQGETALVIAASAPTKDAFTAFWPTYLAMLKSITAAPASAK